MKPLRSVPLALATFYFYSALNTACGTDSAGKEVVNGTAKDAGESDSEFTLEMEPDYLEDAGVEKIINKEDTYEIRSLSPSSYWFMDEAGFDCRGRYNGKWYSGNEQVVVQDADGVPLSTVCGKFFDTLRMEGSGIAEAYNPGEWVVLNYHGKKRGKTRFKRVGHCIYGMGIKEKCLLPFYSIAAVTAKKTEGGFNVGDIIYIPQMEGAVLPDGTRHQGFFEMRDTGGAFRGKKKLHRIDLFVGYDDNHNFWSGKGFNHHHRFRAYKVVGESKKRAQEWLKDRFGDLY